MMALAGRDAQGETRVFWVANGPTASDFNGDGIVGFADFLIFLRSYNTEPDDTAHDPRTDLDGDGATTFRDFLSFQSAYGHAQAPETPTGDRFIIYVADSDDGSVMAINYDTHLILDFLPFRGPGGVLVSPDQKAIYVSEVFGFFRLNTRHEVDFSVPVESRGKAVLSPDATRAYVTDQVADMLRIVDVVQGVTLDSVVVGDRPIDIAITSDGKKLYVANQNSRDITVIDVASKQRLAEIELGAIPGEISIVQDGSRAYVTELDRGVISVLDLRTDRVVGAIQLDQEFSFGAEFSPDGQTLYVSADGFLLAIDVQRNLIVRTLKISNQSTVLGISPSGERAYVTTFTQQAGGPALVVVDLANWRVMGSWRGVLFPRQIAFRTIAEPGGAQ